MEQLIDLLYLDQRLESTGVIYPTAVILRAVQDFEDRIKSSGGILGECSMPTGTDMEQEPSLRYTSIDMGRVSHIVQHAWVENNLLKCKVKLLGQYAQIAELMPVEYEGIPRATGAVEGNPRDRVCTEYTLITVDLSLTEIK